METETEYGKVITSDMERKYWLIIPSIGSPMMVSQHADLGFVKELATKELKNSYNNKMSARIVKHEGSIYKYGGADIPTSIPNEKLLFDLVPGDKIKTVKRLYEDGTIKQSPAEYVVVEPYWISMNEKTGDLKVESTTGDMTRLTKRLSPDGRDDTGIISVIF